LEQNGSHQAAMNANGASSKQHKAHAAKASQQPRRVGKLKTRDRVDRHGRRGALGHAQLLPHILDASDIRYIYREARFRYHRLKETTPALNAKYLTPLAFRAVYESCSIHMRNNKAETDIMKSWEGMHDKFVKDAVQNRNTYEEMSQHARDEGVIPTWEEPIKEMISFLSASNDPKLERLRNALARTASASLTNLQKLEDLKKMCADQLEELRELRDILGASTENTFETRMRIVLTELTHSQDALKLAALKRVSAIVRTGEAAGWAAIHARSKTDDADFDDNESVVTDGSAAYHDYDDEGQAGWRQGQGDALSKTVKKVRQIVATNCAFKALTGNNLNDDQAGRRSVSIYSQASRIDSRHVDARHSNMFARMERMKLQALTAMGGMQLNSQDTSRGWNPKILMRKGRQRKSYFDSVLDTWAEDDNDDQQAVLRDLRNSATIVRRPRRSTKNSPQDESLCFDAEVDSGGKTGEGLGDTGAEAECSGSGAEGSPVHRHRRLAVGVEAQLCTASTGFPEII